MWSEWRAADGGLHGNTHEFDAALAGRRVELVFGPFDLTRPCRSVGPAGPWEPAVPHRTGHQVHAKARPEPDSPPAAADGITTCRWSGPSTHRGIGRPGPLRPTYPTLGPTTPRAPPDGRGQQ